MCLPTTLQTELLLSTCCLLKHLLHRRLTAQKGLGGWIYDGIEAFNTLPGSYRCPVCNAPKRRRAHVQLGFLQSPVHSNILLRA